MVDWRLFVSATGMLDFTGAAGTFFWLLDFAPSHHRESGFTTVTFRAIKDNF